MLMELGDRQLYPNGASVSLVVDVVGSEVLERVFRHHLVEYRKAVSGPKLAAHMLSRGQGKWSELAALVLPFLRGA